MLAPHVEMSIASPLGNSVVDPISVERFKDDAYCQEFYRSKKFLWETTDKLSSYLGRAEDFDVIFIGGGFGRKIPTSIPHFYVCDRRMME